MGFVSVALGGALGALGRYAVSLLPCRSTFPVLTLLTNILGAVIIGFIAGLASSRKDISRESLLFWKTGVCGGFTTFSTFSLETVTLLEQHHTGQALLYMILSVGFCLLGILCGRRLSEFIS